MTSGSGARIGVVLVAAAAALIPLPPDWIERWYSRGLYPAIQSRLTATTNVLGFALFDFLIAGLIVAALILLARRIRRRRALGLVRVLVRWFGDLLVLAAIAYLAFLVLWGLNYRRVPLERKVDYNEARVTPDAARQFALDTVRHLNSIHDEAHRPVVTGRSLSDAFQAAQRRLGAARLATPGTPKRSLLELYFRRAAIDGMTDPFFLEVILNPDVLAVEQPFVLAHEWGHLAGYASEAEANLLAWVTCLEGNALARYSGWLAIYGHIMNTLPRAEARAIAEGLDAGPRADLAAISARLARSSPVVRTVARDTYDAYLRANRIPEGIANYDAVVRLILGAGADNGWAPRAVSH
jgi:uncharacterized protein DUF3810